MTRVGIVALGLVLTAGSAQAEFLNGNKLYEICTSPEGLLQMQCLGYVQAASDSMRSARLANHAPQCVPTEATGRQVVDVVVNYLRDRPQDRTYPADWLVTIALGKAWGCSGLKP